MCEDASGKGCIGQHSGAHSPSPLNPVSFTDWGETALMKASEKGQVECVKVLLHGGVQVNVQNEILLHGVPYPMGVEGLIWGLHHLAPSTAFGSTLNVLVNLHSTVVNIGEAYATGLSTPSGIMWDSTAPSPYGLTSHDRVKMVISVSISGLKSKANGKSRFILPGGWGRLGEYEDGDTALHLAARGNKASCVRALLSHPGIDINIKNNRERTAMMVAGYRCLGVFNQMVKTRNEFPVDSYGKVVLCGNSGAGKSTLTQIAVLLLLLLAMGAALLLALGAALLLALGAALLLLLAADGRGAALHLAAGGAESQHLVPAMGAMWVVVAAARVAAGKVVVGALVPILVPVVGLVQIAVLLLLLLAVGAALLLLALGAALLLLVVAALWTVGGQHCI
ncbi:hypothetical protein EMCRGX_G011573 [Ephydatia muelleri]